jgi:hypothetical protein
MVAPLRELIKFVVSLFLIKLEAEKVPDIEENAKVLFAPLMIN